MTLDVGSLESDYGIWIDGRNMTSTLSVQSVDEALYDYQFELTIK